MKLKTRFALSAVSLLLAGAFTAPDARGAVTYTSGHADIGVAYEDGAFDLHFHSEGGVIDGVETNGEYAPGDVIIRADSANLTLPMDFPALGKVSGETIWVLPWTQEEGLPFLGLASEELNPDDWDSSGITFTITQATCLGDPAASFAMWRYDVFGGIILDASSLTGPSSISTTTGGHDHFNFGFSTPGAWDVTFTVTGTNNSDGPVSATGTFRFDVVPEPSSALLGVLGTGLLVLRRRR
ncbi:choice-of-anchor M domain-containing protein [Luteolibacter ambystomatis]|uniref:Choice-of-anchor M domain-containing protein n=1 Tax=Luteolibacter ambystomatis TaxID=2824561 RepID=A0A975G6R0_9BACT|nr:choice-of-anchor M domain-containing protein [Luteolibacter ambystomatis]QUE49285.1 choice-of-anchor M domain-containing protein [Luteolibacter ambystomatis]